jgi:hypothetical protein
MKHIVKWKTTAQVNAWLDLTQAFRVAISSSLTATPAIVIGATR